jgi:hypothetical protein
VPKNPSTINNSAIQAKIPSLLTWETQVNAKKWFDPFLALLTAESVKKSGKRTTTDCYFERQVDYLRSDWDA